MNPFSRVVYDGPLRLEKVLGTKKGYDYRLLDDFPIRFWRVGKAVYQKLVVPAGFVTDKASVPWWARWLVSKDGHHVEASVVHDYMYCEGPGKGFTREDADMLFRAAMRSTRTPWWMGTVAYYAVRLGGGFVWRRHPGR